MSLAWTKHPRRQDTEVSRWRIWIAKGTSYRVVESTSKFGLPTRLVAMLGEREILSRHKQLGAAKEACERHARRQMRLLGCS